MDDTMPSSIPVIDLEPLRCGDPDRLKMASGELLQAMTSIGFVYLKNHGIPQQQIDEAFQWVCDSGPPHTAASRALIMPALTCIES